MKNKNNGFTLIELLAVILILAIVIIIAVPQVQEIIKKARLDSFNSSSKLIEDMGRTYLNKKGITVEEGETKEILYSNLRDEGYIEKIVDPISKEECANSKVLFTKTNGKYIYEGALVCDNYIDIDAYNLISNHDFSNGVTGWNNLTYATEEVKQEKLYLTVTTNNSEHYTRSDKPTPIVGHKYYLRGTKTGNNNGQGEIISINRKADGTYQIVSTGPSATKKTDSIIFTVDSIYSTPDFYVRLRIRDNLGNSVFSGNGEGAIFDNIILFDLTSIYSVGNEPTKAEMNTIMSNMGK